MPDNLRISAPITNTEGINKPNPAAEPSHLTPVNPNRVPQTANEAKSDSQAADLLLNRNSVFSQFIRQLTETPDLTGTLQKLLSSAASGQGIALERLPVDSPLRALASSLATEKDGMLENLIFQQQDNTQFTGALFKLLGQISQQSGDAQLDLRVANFLKAFTGYYTAADTTQAILSNLEEIKYSIPLPYAKKLMPLMAKLLDGRDPSHIPTNLTIIKKEIIPLLSEYVTLTNDYGKSRDTISMLLHNTAVLNDSTKENLADKFNELFRYCKYNLKLSDVTVNMLQSLFAQEVYSRQQKKTNPFMSALTSLLAQASNKNSPSGVDKTVLNDISRSILLDNSVYMPFQHFFLPAEIGNRFLFSQIWVEKKDPEEAGSSIIGKPKPKSVYLTFEIQDLGYFEASVHILGKQVNMKLSCPPAFDRLHGEIRTGVTQILEKNGLSAENVKLSSCVSPQIPQIIMNKIQERKRAVDVSV